MKNYKICIISALISSALIGCGGDSGGSDSTTFDDIQVVSYDFENIVEAFLNAGIDYTTQYVTDGYSNELVKYYDQDNNPIDFLIPTNTVTKYGCTAEPLALDKRGVSYNSASFNVEPITDNRRLVSFKSLPKSFVNKDFGKKICKYSNFSYSSNYIVGTSNQKLVELTDDESVFKPTDYVKLSAVKRLLIVEDQTTIEDSATKLKPYLSSSLNYAAHEFIVNENGEVKTFEDPTGQYVALPGTVGSEWQFYSDKYLVSKPHGGVVSVYDITQKRRVSGASISVLQNHETNLATLDKVTLSYGIWSGLDDSNNYGLPFKLVSENHGNSHNLYLWDGAKWVVTEDVINKQWYSDSKLLLNSLPSVTKSNDDGVYLNSGDDHFIASQAVSTGGFNIVSGNISNPFTANAKTVTDFVDYLNGVQLINGKITIETSNRKIYEKKAFFFIDGDKKQIIGNPGENITAVKASVHN